jgi:hypothetical protein
MPDRSFAPLSLCAALALATPLAADPGGSLLLDIDGAPAAYDLWTSQSDHSGSPNWRSVNIYARADAGADGYGTFTLGFSVVNGAASAPEASLRSEAGTLFSREEAGALEVTVTEVAPDGSLLVLTGSFSGNFGTSDNFGRDIDLSDPVAVEGSFALRLPELD